MKRRTSNIELNMKYRSAFGKEVVGQRPARQPGEGDGFSSLVSGHHAGLDPASRVFEAPGGRIPDLRSARPDEPVNGSKIISIGGFTL
jgi:hypothetical protein